MEHQNLTSSHQRDVSRVGLISSTLDSLQLKQKLSPTKAYIRKIIILICLVTVLFERNLKF